MRGRASFGVAASLALTAAVAGCGSTAASPGPTAADEATVSLATSAATARGSWAVLPVSAGAGADNTFWEVLVRSASSASWRLVTPPGAADNGGLVAAASEPRTLTVAVRPSQRLRYSPLTTTVNGGASWSAAGPVDAAVAATPGALAASGGKLVALLTDGTIETSADAGASWAVLGRPATIAASPAGRGCGGRARVTTVTFGLTDAQVLAGGTCGASGITAVFSYATGTGWRRADLPARGTVLRLGASTALVQGQAGLTALSGAGWTKSVTLPVSGPVTAAGGLPQGGSWVLLPGRRAATITGTGRQWVLVPAVPTDTSVLAAGPGGTVDALAVSGGTVTVWRLAPARTVWSRVQLISVPVQSANG